MLSKCTKSSRQPWLNETTRALRHDVQRENGKSILHDRLTKYQKTDKAAKSAFLSSVISTSSHKPRFLFNIFNSVVNPCATVPSVASFAL